MQVAWARPWVRRHSIRFEAIVESHARIWPRSGARWAHAVAPPYCGEVACRRTAQAHTLDDCLRCDAFVQLRPAPDRRWATMRCLCSDDDPIGCVPGSAPLRLAVAPELPAQAARLVASLQETPILVVESDGLVVGVVHTDALAHAQGPVAAHMVVQPWCLPADATLGGAVEALTELGVPALLVVRDGTELVGVIGSVAQFRRLGVPEEVLPP